MCLVPTDEVTRITRLPVGLWSRFYALGVQPFFVEDVEELAIDMRLEVLDPLRRERHPAVVVIWGHVAGVDVEAGFHRLGRKLAKQCVAAEEGRVETVVGNDCDRLQADIAALATGRSARLDPRDEKVRGLRICSLEHEQAMGEQGPGSIGVRGR